MPIKPENKNRYPLHWKQLSEYIRFERAGNKCEVCGVENYAVGYRDSEGKFYDHNVIMDALDNRGYDYFEHELINCWTKKGEPTKCIKIILTVAHLDHQPENNSLDNLKAMCQKCHNNYDRSHRNQTRRTIKNQLSLL